MKFAETLFNNSFVAGITNTNFKTFITSRTFVEGWLRTLDCSILRRDHSERLNCYEEFSVRFSIHSVTLSFFFKP